jgi:hypothetical protein
MEVVVIYFKVLPCSTRGTKESHRRNIKIIDVPASIRRRHLQNTRENCHRLSEPAQCD